jgi:hypothetical protein
MSEDPILAAIEALRTDLGGGIEGLRVDVMARLDRQENQLTAIRDDIATNFGTADAARRANDKTREEVKALSDVVAAMQRQIHRLQTDVLELKGEK